MNSYIGSKILKKGDKLNLLNLLHFELNHDIS